MSAVARILLLCGCLAGPAADAVASDWARPAAACPPAVAASPGAFESVFRTAAPAVVRVLSVRYRRPDDVEPHHQPFLPLSGSTPQGALIAERSAASGFIVSADGLVLGSAHAVLGAAETWVELRDGHQWRARIVGLDPQLDLAVLKIDARGLPVLAVAHDDPRPGQWVAAIGAPFGFEQSISAGMVSAFPRELPGVAGVGLVQTDVAINPGSSGGPLLDACGQVVGMSAMIFSSQGLYVGVTFAVPARRLLQAAAAMLDPEPHGSAGLRAQTLTPALAHAFAVPRSEGAVVVRVEPGGAAASAGLREGDVVLAVDGSRASSADSLDEHLAALPAGRRVAVEVWRDGALRRMELSLQAAAPPPPQSPRSAGQPRLGLLFGKPAGGPSPTGLHVVAAEGAGMLAGIEEGDCIAAVNGRRVSTPEEFDQALAAARAAGARTVALLVDREGVRAYLPVRAGDGPADPGRRATPP